MNGLANVKTMARLAVIGQRLERFERLERLERERSDIEED